MADRRVLSGWARTMPVSAQVVPGSEARILEALRNPEPRGMIARGLGRSYGDAAQNAGGTVLDMASEEDLSLDLVEQSADFPAGLSVNAALSALVPRGFYLPVVPGTSFVTIGGALASDVHGKNHHGQGGLGRHVVSFDLIDGTGQKHHVTETSDPGLFWGTIGGMGLTGVVTSVRLRLQPVETGYVTVRTERLVGIEQLMRRMVGCDADVTYSVAWVDVASSGGRLGRSVLSSGEHTSYEELTQRQRRHRHPAPGSPRLRVPEGVPSGLVNRWSIRAFDEAWFRVTRDETRVQRHGAFFFPLDAVDLWNRVYGAHGFVQYQFVVPDRAAQVVPEVIGRVVGSGGAAALAVLKRLGAANPGPLSFPAPGWTLALDLPRTRSNGSLLNSLDAVVAEAGGRIYLAKDSRTSPAQLERMYPRLEEFAALRDRVDPDRRFVSDLSRRLGL